MLTLPCFPVFFSFYHKTFIFNVKSSGTTHMVSCFHILLLLIPPVFPNSFLSIFNLWLTLYFSSLPALLPIKMSPSRWRACVSTLWAFGRTTVSYLCSKSEQRAFGGHITCLHIIGSFIILSYRDRTNNHLGLIPTECKDMAASAAVLLWMNVR